jgi:hypothetical protein
MVDGLIIVWADEGQGFPDKLEKLRFSFQPTLFGTAAVMLRSRSWVDWIILEFS